jgi:hypothetical protein
MAALAPVMEPDGNAHGKNDDNDLDEYFLHLVPQVHAGGPENGQCLFGMLDDLVLCYVLFASLSYF